MTVTKISRRTLLVAAAGGTVAIGGAGLWLAVERLGAQRFRTPVDRGASFAPSVFLSIEPTGRITIWLTRAEMGQGVGTALPMLIAEELDANWDTVEVQAAVAGDGHDYGNLFTVGSASVASSWTELRQAGAAARSMLVSAAAKVWGIKASGCSTADGHVLDPESGRKASYGDLAGLAARESVPLRPRLKSENLFTLIGRSVGRTDSPAKSSGAAIYGLDVRQPGMLFGVVARPPGIGETLRSFDAARALAMPGVRDVFRIDSGIAVVADSTHHAIAARDMLEADWRPGEGAAMSTEAIQQALKSVAGSGPAAIALRRGDARRALTNARRTIESHYSTPFLAHATLEPMNCVASVERGRCEVWAPTQAPSDARAMAAAISRLSIEAVKVHTTAIGGGFGRRVASDFVAEAVAMSMRVGVPVQAMWTREDDLRHGFYREASAHHIRAAVGPAGVPEGWIHRVATTTVEKPPADTVYGSVVMGASDLPYSVDALQVEWSSVQTPVRTGLWRSVGYSYNTFAVESFVDELAEHAKADPVEFRQRMLSGSPRLRSCLDRVAVLSRWSDRAREGRALGVAVCQAFGSHIAQVAEVQKDPRGTPHVTDIWCVVDCGIAVNPATVIAQIEGGTIFALTAALHGSVNVQDGKVVEGNFDSYPLLRIHEIPRITVELLPSRAPPGGVGELAVPAVAPAVANAWYQAAGARMRQLPINRSATASA